MPQSSQDSHIGKQHDPSEFLPPQSTASIHPWLSGSETEQLLQKANAAGATIVTNPTTGGRKGQKLARYDLIPTLPLEKLAEQYGRGAAKYDERNWERGYDWSLSYEAAQRHLNQFWSGEDWDDE